MRENSEVHYKQTEEGDILTDDAGNSLRLSGEPIVYTEEDWTIDPGEGLEGSSNLRITVINGVAYLEGWLGFDEAAAQDRLNFTLPEGTYPARVQEFTLVAWDNSANIRKPARINITTDGDVEIEMFDGTDWAEWDNITLSGSYLLT